MPHTRSLLGILGICLVGMLCARSLSAQETWGPSPTMGESAANSSGITCPTGKYAIGLQVRAGTYIHMIQLECAGLGPAGEHQSIQMMSSYISPGSGGTPRQLRCSSGEVMIGFRGRAGWWIDRIQVACKPWRAGVGTDGTLHWTTTAGGTGGEAYGPVTCPGRMAIYSLSGYWAAPPFSGAVVYGYRFSCKAS